MKFERIAKWVTHESGVELSDGRSKLQIDLVSDDIVRIRWNKPQTDPKISCLVPDLPARPTGVEITEESTGNGIIIRTKLIKILLGCHPFTCKINDTAGRPIVEMRDGCLEDTGRRTAVRLQMGETDQICGLGQGTFPHLNLRGQERRMWHQWRANTQSGPAGIPMMLNTRGYGLFLNTASPARFVIGEGKLSPSPDPDYADSRAPSPWPTDQHSGENDPDRIAILVDDRHLDLFLIIRRGFPAVLQAYSDLTGYPPMPPLWALGYIQSKNRYRNARELLEVAREFKARGIPADVLVIDWLWFKTYGDLDWDRDSWPDPCAMLAELAAMGFKILQAQHPFVDRGSLHWDEFLARGYLVTTGFENKNNPLAHDSIFDFTNPEARADWWRESQKLYSQGIAGFWADMGEPAQHPVGCLHYLGTREDVHNIYCLCWAKCLYDGQRSFTNRRVFSLHRTAYAGIQRYGAALWSGDINSDWEMLRDQVIIGQQVCMSGQPYWTTDIGGFILPKSHYEAELFLRWLQWGVLCLIFRTHGTRSGNEPWSFGPEAESIITRYLRLRYELMPYIYAQARATSETGLSMQRAMVICYPEDDRAVSSELQFMFGPSLLVAPVVERGARRRQVYLPQGRWFDFWTDQSYTGPAEIDVFAPLERIPLFVKAGSVLPLADGTNVARQGYWNALRLNVYTGAGGRFELYEDDGATYDYEKGQYAKTEITYDEGDGVCQLTIGRPKVCSQASRCIVRIKLFFMAWRGHARLK